MKQYVIAFVALAACSEEKSTTPAPMQRWEKIRAVDDTTPLEGPARALASPSSSSVVTPAFRATVVNVLVREGDFVDAGTPMVEVLMPELLDAAGRHEGARVRLTAWSEREQQLTALRTDGLARATDVSDATARVAEARADLQAARAVLLSAGVREREVGALLSGGGVLTLKSPLHGVVTRVTATPGESREPSAGPLVSVSGAGAIRIEARFPRSVPEGEWQFIDGTGERSKLTLKSRAPTADSRDGTFVAWFEPSAELTAGALGRAVFSPSDKPTSFLVAATAIQRDDGVTSVETKHGRIPVTVIRCEGETCTTTGALTVDDEVRVESP